MDRVGYLGCALTRLPESLLEKTFIGTETKNQAFKLVFDTGQNQYELSGGRASG